MNRDGRCFDSSSAALTEQLGLHSFIGVSPPGSHVQVAPPSLTPLSPLSPELAYTVDPIQGPDGGTLDLVRLQFGETQGNKFRK